MWEAAVFRQKTSKGREVAKSMTNPLKFSFPLKSAADSKSSSPSLTHPALLRGRFPGHTCQFMPTLSWAVLFQQTSADPQHPSAAGGRCHCLPAVFLSVIWKVAPDHLSGTHSLQQLLCLLQAAAGPPGIGQGLLVFSQLPEGPGPPVLLSSGVTPGTAFRLQPGSPWEGSVGEEWVRGKKRTKKKNLPELCIFVTYCFFLW